MIPSYPFMSDLIATAEIATGIKNKGVTISRRIQKNNGDHFLDFERKMSFVSMFSVILAEKL